MDNQTSPYSLRDLLQNYEKKVTELNNSIDYATQLNNSLAIAKAAVTKNKHLLDLIKEQIMTEKLILRSGQG